MKVARFNDSTVAPALIPGTAPKPVPGSGEVLVSIHAAGVTPSELVWYPTTHARNGSARTDAIPGQASQAYGGTIPNRHGRGKVVLSIAQP